MKKGLDLTVDEIHELRTKEYESIKHLSDKELIKYYNESARPLKEAIEKRKKVKERKET